MARTETPLFRRALALVALWCLLWAVLGWLSHRAIPTYDRRAGYAEAMQACADDRLLAAANGELLARRPNRREMFACTERTRGRFIAAESAQHRQVSVMVLAWALLPSLILVLLAAFAAEIGRLLRTRRPG
ncbi:MAG TPA: hypothetical protein VEC11_05885 [Allosphingosinicella sp.]|nr:hypothetical protein [Allosphingosinicella sp.]